MMVSCLSTETLSNYVEGRLSVYWKQRVEKHLSKCDACLETIIVFRKIAEKDHFIDSEVAPTSVTRRAIMATLNLDKERWSDRIASNFRARTIGWATRWRIMRSRALFSVRGHKNFLTEDFCFVNKSYRDLNLEIGIEKNSQKTAHVRVNLLNGPHTKLTTRVTLYRNDHEREIASFLLDDASVLFENISNGHYTLVFTRNGKKIGQYRFHLKESHDER
jgi:hypothetical protein